MQYFGNVSHNSAIPDTFAPKIVNVMNQTGLWDAELTWYSSNAICHICIYGLKHNLRIHGCRPIWSCLNIEFLQPPAYCNQLRITNVFDFFCSIMVQFELVKQIRLCCTFICSAFKSQWSEAMHNMAVHQLPWYYPQHWVLSMSWTASITSYIHATN